MTSSDDESEAVPENVSEYEFMSGEDEPVSFAVLPLEWVEGEARDGKPQEIFLSGKTDDGLQKIYKQVIAWKFDLPSNKPVISVLSAEGYWMKLLKPWRPFHHIIRTIQVTLHVLHFAKWNPQRNLKALRDHLKRTFSMFETVPCEDDLADHLPLINEAVKRDTNLANSKILSTLLAEKPWERKTINEGVKPPFIVDDADGKDQGEFDKTDVNGDDGMDESGDDGSEEDDCYDAVCAICDNGGHLYLCDGKCMRSFHATAEDGEDSHCESLGLTDVELRALENAAFYCENCKYKMHQCFACGELGSSDESSNPEVFCCVNGACGYFYHPHCVAKLLHPGNHAAAEELEQKIAAGEKFACPAHRCLVCEEVEVRSMRELQFAVCRRCPQAYHRKCLPREITSADDVDEEKGIIQRAWEENLLPNRILIYCLDHEIDPDLLTPVRDHIKFPEEKKKNIPLESSKKKKLSKERGLALENNVGNKISAKPPRGVDKASCSSLRGDLPRKRVDRFPVHAASKKQKVATNGYSLGKSKPSKTDGGQRSLGDQSSIYVTDTEQVKCSNGGVVLGNHEITQKVKPSAKRTDTSLTLDDDSRERTSALMNDALFSVTLDLVKERHILTSTHVQYSKLSFENITMGKVEGSVQALRAARKKMDEGGCIQDAKAVCGDALLLQVSRWREKLKVRLAPFLHGERYTSFGRHFTKLDKLKEIVNILHWYVQDGDMLVDFCCGSNDFSCLMKKKVDDMGKRCSFKNYDIHQAKNDFNFERRDWMGVKPNELPDGSQLIMGLNPPFGVKASLANKFIKKALEFKPKLLILIVPRETQRLDAKESPYDLIWEDDQIFVGKSFYLPGSVDVNDKQIEDWNVNAPLLYLWSRSNWTTKHRAIAEQHGHLSGALKNYRSDGSCNEMHVPRSAQVSSEPDNLVKQGDDLHVDKPENLEQTNSATTTANHQEGLPCDVNGNEGAKNDTPVKNYSELKLKEFGGKGNDKSNFFDEGKKNRRSLEDKSEFDGEGGKNGGSVEDKSDIGDTGKKNKQSLDDRLDFGDEAKKNKQSPEDRSDFGDKGKKNKQSPEDRSDFGDKGKKNKQSLVDKSDFGAKGKKNRRSLEDKSARKPSVPHHLSPDVDKSTRKPSVPHHLSPYMDKSPRNPLVPHHLSPNVENSTRKLSVPHHPSQNVVDHSETYSPRHIETRARGHSGRVDHPQFDGSNSSRYQPYSQAGYNGDEGMDDVVRRYTLNIDESCHGTTSRHAYSPSPPPHYAFRAPTDRFVGPLEGRVNNFDEPCLSYQRTAHPSYRHPGIPSIPHWEMGTSAMQRYAPRLDEMNHARMSNMVPGPVYHPRGPPPAFHGSLSFAPGLRPSYPQHSSSGWLNE